jgi:hypothetical protein
MYPTYTPPETTAADVFSAFAIGFDLLPIPPWINGDSIIKAISENPMNRLDILLAGLLELVDTLPAEEAAGQVGLTLYGVAALLDGIDIAEQ